MKNRATLPIEFLAGTCLEDAIEEAKQKAVDLGFCYVTFKFNGVSFSVSRNADVADMADEYVKGRHKYGIVG